MTFELYKQKSTLNGISKEVDNEISINKIYDSIAPITIPFLPDVFQYF